MLKSPHPNLIESDEGFAVQVLAGGELGIIYREGSRAVKVLSEPARDPVGYIVYKNSIRRWAPPPNGEVIDSECCNRIVCNLRKAFLFQGLNIEINDSEEFNDAILNRLQEIE